MDESDEIHALFRCRWGVYVLLHRARAGGDVGAGRGRVATAGHYALQTYNDEPPPFEADGSVTAVDLQLSDDGTCSVTATTESGIVTIDTEEDCSWSASGRVITVLTESDYGAATGSLIDGTLTLTDQDNGDVFVYLWREWDSILGQSLEQDENRTDSRNVIFGSPSSEYACWSRLDSDTIWSVSIRRWLFS